MTSSPDTPRRRGPKPVDRTADPAWARLLKALTTHLRTHPDASDATTEVQQWADQRIRELRTGSRPTTEQQALAAAGLTAETPTTTEARRQQRWEHFLAELDWWISQHGDARVPQLARSRNGYWLGKQVSTYRIEYGRDNLTDEVIGELEKRRGWMWRAMEDRWDMQWSDNCSRLEQAVKDGRHPNDLRLTDNPLYQWMLRQRASLQELPTDRRRRFARIPGALPTDQRVPDFVKAAKLWLRKHPTQKMAQLPYRETVTLPDGQDYPLGRRSSYFRRRYHGLEARALPLTQEEITLLETLRGWSWQINAAPRQKSDSAP